jgi:hypothetical protein
MRSRLGSTVILGGTICRQGTPQPQNEDRSDRRHKKIAEPALELEIHQTGQRAADKRPSLGAAASPIGTANRPKR